MSTSADQADQADQASSSSTLNKTPSGTTAASNATTSTGTSLPPDNSPPVKDTSSPPPPPSDSSPGANVPSVGGSKQINTPGADSSNHILVALLTVSTVLIVIFAIGTTFYYMRKKRQQKKKNGVTIPTSSTENKNIQEQPIRYKFDESGWSDSMIQSPDHALIPGPPPILKEITIDRFLKRVENDKPRRFSPNEIENLITRGSKTKLGSGAFGVVYKGVLENGILVAVKKLKDDKSVKKMQQQFMAEVGSIGNTHHINLVRLLGYCIDPNMAALVYEYMENGSLDNFLFNENYKAKIQLGKLHEIAIGAAKGIAYLHEECQPRRIHYDIKPENILLDANFTPKIADFGLSKICGIGKSYATMDRCGRRGTRGYVAPEMGTISTPTYKCDIYSFGIVLFEIVGRRRNADPMAVTYESLSSRGWEMFKKNEWLDLVLVWGIEERDREKAKRIVMVALLCIQHLPEKRPVMSNVVKMLEGEMEIPAPSYPFERHESVEMAAGGTRNSLMTDSPLRKSKTTLGVYVEV